MSKYLGCSLLVLGWVVACGGSTGDGEGTGAAGSGGSSAAGTGSSGSSSGGSSNGGNPSAGSNSGGSVSNGGTPNAGASNGGTPNAGTGNGGTPNAGAGNGGAGGMSVDSRCPPKRPMGACTAEQTDALCEYDLLTGCLCYSPSQITTRCTQVDPTCTASSPPPDESAGGGAAKIALPPKQVCRCSGGSWQCT